MRAVVAGGGLAGLAAAWGLVRAGIDTILLEAAPVPGGLAAGFSDRGYAFDLVPRALGGGDPEVRRLCEAWSGRPLLRSRRSSRILVDGRLLRHPPDIRDLFGPRGLSIAAGALAGRLQARLGRGVQEAPDYASFVTARFGAPLFERVFGPIAEKITGVPAHELSSGMARDALHGPGLMAQLLAKIAGRELPWEEQLAPEEGLHAIPEKLSRALQRAGAGVLLSHRVTRLRGGPGRIDEVLAEGPEGAVRARADLIVSTIPMPALLAALETPEAEARAAAARLRTRGLVVVYLGIRRERVTADHDILVPDPAVRFHRLSETVNHAPRMAPRGATGLCAEIACDRFDRIWNEDDGSHVRRVIGDLCDLGFLRSTGEVEAAWVRRFPDAVPVFTLEHPSLVEAIERSLQAIGNLRRCGRQGGLFPGGPGGSLRQGLDAAHAAAALAPPAPSLAPAAPDPRLAGRAA